MSQAIIQTNQTAIEQLPSSLQDAFETLLYSLSESSKRQYQHSFNLWFQYCQQQGLDRLALSAKNVIGFLETGNIGYSTKQARLSHLRKLLQTLQVADSRNEDFKAYAGQLKLLKLKRTEGEKQSERASHALSRNEIYSAFLAWQGNSLKAVRNRALLAILIYAGLRRSEAAALKWADIDFNNGIITIRHGKGDKKREVPFLGEIENYLSPWQVASAGRVYVFCAIRKGDHFGNDKPMNTKNIYEVLRETGDAIGIEFLAPHDMRRTLITNALSAGASVADMQFVAGHSQPATTLRYAKVKSAQDVKGRLKDNLGF